MVFPAGLRMLTATAAVAVALVGCQAAPPPTTAPPPANSFPTSSAQPDTPASPRSAPTGSSSPAATATTGLETSAPATATPLAPATPAAMSELPFARVFARTAAGPVPSSMAWAGDRLWLADHFGVAQLDPATGAVIDRLGLGPLTSVTAVPGTEQLLVGSFLDEYVVLVDPATGATTARTEVPCPTELAATAAGEAWVTSPCVGQVSRVSLGAGVVGTASVSEPGPIAAGGDAAWVIGDRSLLRIDPVTFQKRQVYPATLGFPTDVAYSESDSGDGRVWATGVTTAVVPSGALVSIDPESLDAERVDAGSGALARPLDSVAVHGGDVWVTGLAHEGNFFEVPRVLTRVDFETGTAAEQFVLPPASAILAGGAADDELWLSANVHEVIGVRATEGDAELPPVVATNVDGLGFATTTFTGSQPDWVYLPDEESDLPTFVLVGGGPTPPSEVHHMSGLATALAARGAVVHVLGYRSETTGNTVDDTVADIRCGVAFARVATAEYGGSETVALVGFSYGGEVALTAATSQGGPSPDCAASGETAPDSVVALDPLAVESAGAGTEIPMLYLGALRGGNAAAGRTLTAEMEAAGYDVEFVELDVDHGTMVDPRPAVGVVDLIVNFASGGND